MALKYVVKGAFTNRKRMAGSILQESMGESMTFTQCNIIIKYQLISPYDLINPDQDHVVAGIKIAITWKKSVHVTWKALRVRGSDRDGGS